MYGAVCVRVCVCVQGCVVVVLVVAASALSGLLSTQLEFSFLQGAGQDCAGGARGPRGAPLLIPQDGVLVVKLQVLHGRTAGLLSTTVPVFHHLKGLLHLSVLACLHVLSSGH